MELSFDLAIALLGLYPQNPETPIQKIQWTSMFIAALFTTAKCCKQPNCPSINEWIKKKWHFYTMEYYAAETKKDLLPFMTEWMTLENTMLSEINQSMRDKYHTVSPIEELNEQK